LNRKLPMKKALFTILFCFAIGCFCHAQQEKRVLVFSKTSGGYRHQSIGAGKLAIMQLGREAGFAVDTTEDANAFTEGNLIQYDVVVFLSTSGNPLNGEQEVAFEKFIQTGKGFVGIHGATACEYEWGWYGRLLGAYFNGHPEIQEARFVEPDKTFAATSHLPDVWTRRDELYNYKQWTGDNRVVLKLDETSYKGGTMNGDHPIAWYKEFDGGRMFYTGLGHTNESFADPVFLKHLLEGILYSMN